MPLLLSYDNLLVVEYGSLDGASTEVLVTNNVGVAYPAIVGSVVAVDANKGATADVAAAVGVWNNIDAPAIPPHW